MPAGRPPDRLAHVDRLEGPEELKHRLRVLLETLVGERTIEAACRELGIGEARFHQLRRQALEGALSGLSPGHPGRPAAPPVAIDPSRLALLERRVDELEVELEASRVRYELATSMPATYGPGRKKKAPLENP